MKYLTALFALFILAVIALADMGQLGFLHGLYDFPFGDKAGHFILYGMLSFLLNKTFLRSFSNRVPKRAVWVVSLLLALVIGLEEWSQNFVSARTPDWVDLACSCLGVVVGAWGAWKFRK